MNMLMDEQISFHYLKKLDLSKNKLKQFASKAVSNLNHLILNGNELTDADLDSLRALVILELRSNKLGTIQNIDQCSLVEEVYAAENELDDLNLFNTLNKLRKLHIRKNKLTQIDISTEQWLPTLEYLNVRENLIKDEESVKDSIRFKSLKSFNFLANPVCEENEELIPRLFEEHFLTEEFRRSKLTRDLAELFQQNRDQ